MTLVAVTTLTSTADKSKNIEAIEFVIQKAAKANADWICLPEVMSYSGPYENFAKVAELEDGPLNQRLSFLAKTLNKVVFAGSVCEKVKDSEKVFNTQYVFGRDGSLLAKYRKVNLFNLLTPSGEKLYCESDGFLAGDQCVKFSLDGFKVGLATCYDLRFGEYFRKLFLQDPCDVIVIPSAFTLATGMAHWEILLRARAIEYLSYVLAPNQTGKHAEGKFSFGHAMVIDPWGNKLSDTGEQTLQVGITEISKSYVDECRTRIPIFQ